MGFKSMSLLIISSSVFDSHQNLLCHSGHILQSQFVCDFFLFVYWVKGGRRRRENEICYQSHTKPTYTHTWERYHELFYACVFLYWLEECVCVWKHAKVGTECVLCQIPFQSLNFDDVNLYNSFQTCLVFFFLFRTLASTPISYRICVKWCGFFSLGIENSNRSPDFKKKNVVFVLPKTGFSH